LPRLIAEAFGITPGGRSDGNNGTCDPIEIERVLSLT
jgi:hypothetical protein